VTAEGLLEEIELASSMMEATVLEAMALVRDV